MWLNIRRFLLLLPIVCSNSAPAATEAFQNYLGSVGGYVNGTAGWTFQVRTDVSVTSLGCLNFLFFNNPEPIQVGLWSPDGSLLASSAITSTSTLFNQSRYELISPVNLVPDTIYHLGAYSATGTIIIVGVTGPITMASEIQLRGEAYGIGGFLSPAEANGADGFAIAGPNFQFSAVPEPSSLLLLALGSFAVISAKNSRRCCVKRIAPSSRISSN